MPAAYGLRFGQWKASIDESGLIRRIHARTGRSLERIGAVLMRDAQKSIKRRIVTAGMRQRLSAARQRGDKTAQRRIAQTIERRRSTVSAAGSPPIAHVPDHPVASIRAIYFATGPRSVIVGPVKANQVTTADSNRSSVPELLEFGGTASIYEERIVWPNKTTTAWFRRDLRASVRPWKEYRTRKARYAARPFMGPTLRRNQARIRQILAATFAKAA